MDLHNSDMLRLRCMHALAHTHSYVNETVFEFIKYNIAFEYRSFHNEKERKIRVESI